MKKLLLLVFTLSLLVLGGVPVEATVGGPSHISDIRYNPETFITYYEYVSQSGRGCPVETRTINLVTGEESQIADCNEMQSESFDKELYESTKAEILKDTEPLYSVNIKELGIGVAIVETDQEFYGEDEGILLRTLFEATISQNGDALKTLEMYSCSPEDPIVINGYTVPETNTALFLFSRKGDCFEGGYIYEDLFSVQGLDFDEVSRLGIPKGFEPALANKGNIIVFPETRQTLLPEVASSTEEIVLDEEVEILESEIVASTTSTTTTSVVEVNPPVEKVSVARTNVEKEGVSAFSKKVVIVLELLFLLFLVIIIYVRFPTRK